VFAANVVGTLKDVTYRRAPQYITSAGVILDTVGEVGSTTSNQCEPGYADKNDPVPGEPRG
jgi:hypothetical protein